MQKEILLLAFDKAEKEIGSSKKTHKAQHLAEYLQEECKYPINERTLRDYYSHVLEKKEAQEKVKPIVLSCLCRYLGYEDYTDFINQNSPQGNAKKKNNTPALQAKNKGFIYAVKTVFSTKTPLYMGLITIAAISIFVYSGKHNGTPDEQLECMTWADSLYLKVPCTVGPYSTFGTAIKPLNIYDLKNFKQVKVKQGYQFFNHKDEPLFWYIKNKEGEIEYFTAPGLHPITQKTLKPLTKYMIEKYVPKHTYKKSSFVED